MNEKLDRLTTMKKKLDQHRPLSEELTRSLKEDFSARYLSEKQT